MLPPRPLPSDMRASGRSTTVAARVRGRTSHISSRCGSENTTEPLKFPTCVCQKKKPHGPVGTPMRVQPPGAGSAPRLAGSRGPLDDVAEAAWPVDRLRTSWRSVSCRVGHRAPGLAAHQRVVPVSGRRLALELCRAAHAQIGEYLRHFRACWLPGCRSPGVARSFT